MYTPALKTKYKSEITPALMKQFNYKTVMQVPKLEKIVINQGLGQAIADKKLLEMGVKEVSDIAGQKAVQTVSRKDISNFKLRKSMPIGVMVTLRKDRMYEFLERLIAVALPRIRDFRGLPVNSFDRKGNYTFGLKEITIFPEIDPNTVSAPQGMDITIVTSTEVDKEAMLLLKLLGLPFVNR